jgi:hypothetical protein
MAVVHFGGSAILSAIILSAWITGKSISGGSIVMLSGVTVVGIAESLPDDQQQSAGVLRLGAIFLFCLFL